MPNWLNLSLNIIIYLIMAVGLFGMVIPIYPGVVIIWAAAVIHGLITGFAVQEIWVLVVISLLAFAGTLVDNFLMGGKARQAGASWTSIAGALLWFSSRSTTRTGIRPMDATKIPDPEKRPPSPIKSIV